MKQVFTASLSIVDVMDARFGHEKRETVIESVWHQFTRELTERPRPVRVGAVTVEKKPHDKYQDEITYTARLEIEDFVEEPWAGASCGVEFIGWERSRQIEKEGWTPEHDDAHEMGEMVSAGTCYAAMAQSQVVSQQLGFECIPNKVVLSLWPWAGEWWKPSEDPVRNLVKAGALIAAEIDRLKRAELRASAPLREPSTPEPAV